MNQLQNLTGKHRIQCELRQNRKFSRRDYFKVRMTRELRCFNVSRCKKKVKERMGLDKKLIYSSNDDTCKKKEEG